MGQANPSLTAAQQNGAAAIRAKAGGHTRRLSSVCPHPLAALLLHPRLDPAGGCTAARLAQAAHSRHRHRMQGWVQGFSGHRAALVPSNPDWRQAHVPGTESLGGSPPPGLQVGQRLQILLGAPLAAAGQRGGGMHTPSAGVQARGRYRLVRGRYREGVRRQTPAVVPWQRSSAGSAAGGGGACTQHLPPAGHKRALSRPIGFKKHNKKPPRCTAGAPVRVSRV